MMEGMFFANKLIVLLVAASAVNCAFEGCGLKLEPIGCFTENPADRALEIEILNALDVTSNHYGGEMVNWQIYGPFLEKFLCRCAESAYDQGRKVIGMQFYGECWSTVNAHNDYGRHGTTSTCQKGDFTPCKGNDDVCTGKRNTNFIYRIAPTHCDTYYEPEGCFKDSLILPRPMPKYTMNERNKLHPNWNSVLINWSNWNTYSPQMICRCAAKAKTLQRNYFSIQFYGECWTGMVYDAKFKRDGSSGQCIAKDFAAPRLNSYIAVGKAHANYVYKVSHFSPGK